MLPVPGRVVCSGMVRLVACLEHADARVVNVVLSMAC